MNSGKVELKIAGDIKTKLCLIGLAVEKAGLISKYAPFDKVAVDAETYNKHLKYAFRKYVLSEQSLKVEDGGDLLVVVVQRKTERKLPSLTTTEKSYPEVSPRNKNYRDPDEESVNESELSQDTRTVNRSNSHTDLSEEDFDSSSSDSSSSDEIESELKGYSKEDFDINLFGLKADILQKDLAIVINQADN